MHVEARLLKAFTRDPAGGNPAAVILESPALEGRRQALAAALAVPTTAFVAWRGDAPGIRFFTPLTESSVCLHALVATAHALYADGRLTAGAPARFRAQRDDYLVTVDASGRAAIALPEPSTGAVVQDRRRVTTALGLPPCALAAAPVQVAATGKPKIVVPLASLDALLSADPDPDLVRALCLDVGAEGMFPFAREARAPGASFHARHFNPLALADEDPICGIGTGALGAYLRHHRLHPDGDVMVEQGLATGNPGLVSLRIGARVSVGGTAVEHARRRLAIEPHGARVA